MTKDNVLKATSGYVSKPKSSEKYSRDIQSSEPEVRKYLYRAREAQKEKYYKQEAQIKAGIKDSKAKYITKKIIRNIQKAIPNRLKNRKVLKDRAKVGIKLNQPVYSKDKSRFFKTAWEEEKRQLFFD
jgi:hypothetical protein